MAEKRMRADLLLIERGLCESRSEAQRRIMAGEVRTGPDSVIGKASQLIPDDAELVLTERHKYASRGAHKLLAAIEAFNPEIEARTALDIGASTGGFTDVLLQHGARRVYAVDVGYGQLHYRLRQDERVVSLERTNARHLSKDLIPEPIGVLTADVSFISLRNVLPPCLPLLMNAAWIMVLVKPQFEAGRHDVGKGGVVRDPEVRQRCVDGIVDFAAADLGWQCVGVVPSPITGPKGNQEFVAVFRHHARPAAC